MDDVLSGKVAIVTGAGQGIGKAAAIRLAREGADVVVAEYNLETAQATALEIEAMGRQALAYHIDVSKVDMVRQMVRNVVDHFGRIDILVNNAGVSEIKPLMDITEVDWDRITRVNEKGLFFCLQSVAAHMIEQVPQGIKRAGKADRSYGKIVNLASISGQRGRPLHAHYAASKAAVISITQSAALTLAPYGINVNAVSPGVVKTPLWVKLDEERARLTGAKPGESMVAFLEKVPLKRAATPEEVAAAIYFLCSPESDMITGHTLNVDGGYEMH